MSESIDRLAQLAKFTPSAGMLDRDAMLFAAGKASVRTSRLWPMLAGVLAMSQVATLLLLWPKPIQPEVPVVPVTQLEPAEKFELPTPVSPVPNSILWFRFSENRTETPPLIEGEMVSSSPPIRAGSHLFD